ncbi:hypothetical protein OLMES_0214 [Oleiphilus messinensis]|uniref:Uncharacterized protein n=1 Tax=Oleiphilus messinensis TaxID=141451 RepID=A0A1Y0I1P2_9GAMM|nr:hypothetical protein [Oleiphilus messinensis]ARU54321.1 hypothetical protein OLMES_0214 [Oleiphilus messinensis]
MIKATKYTSFIAGIVFGFLWGLDSYQQELIQSEFWPLEISSQNLTLLSIVYLFVSGFTFMIGFESFKKINGVRHQLSLEQANHKILNELYYPVWVRILFYLLGSFIGMFLPALFF